MTVDIFLVEFFGSGRLPLEVSRTDSAEQPLADRLSPNCESETKHETAANNHRDKVITAGCHNCGGFLASSNGSLATTGGDLPVPYEEYSF